MATAFVQETIAEWTGLETARDRGAVFTPEFLADWVASILREASKIENPAIADFGCGSGNLLSAAATYFPSSKFLGVEIDKESAAIAKDILGDSGAVFADDFLNPVQNGGSTVAESWVARLGGQPDILIMNPPWGAVHTLSNEEVLAAKLSLARGQFDTYDLFCELALQILRPGGLFAFIIPDSIFLPEHEPLRRLLLKRTSISLIARLGEGIFPGVYRGCAVVIGRSTEPEPDHQVECMRLTKSHRSALRDGMTLADLRLATAHFVPQVRFCEDPNCRFDIDVTAADETIGRVLDLAGDWTAPLKSRRGVELSKFGRILICTGCGSARPEPKADYPTCLLCGASLAGEARVIVRDRPGDEGPWRPFIAGEDVRRYSAEVRRWIQAEVPGINYKAAHEAGIPRILVRKTGIGLNAALDDSDAYTNQVVFEYALRDDADFDFSYLHYVLGVLCSRVLLAVHLKRGGDLEWRSHPYVTQKTLAELPIPLPRPNTREWHQASAIAGAVKAHLSGRPCELEIEALVAGLYRLTVEDTSWVLGVLRSAGELEAIKNLRLPVDHTIEPITVQ